MSERNYKAQKIQHPILGTLIYRQSRITPRKKGEFVAVWLRDESGKTRPYDNHDLFDGFIIASETNKAHFYFPRAVLIKEGVVSTSSRLGKRGFRVYEPGLELDSLQAQRTQRWQAPYFVSSPFIPE